MREILRATLEAISVVGFLATLLLILVMTTGCTSTSYIAKDKHLGRIASTHSLKAPERERKIGGTIDGWTNNAKNPDSGVGGKTAGRRFR